MVGSVVRLSESGGLSHPKKMIHTQAFSGGLPLGSQPLSASG